MAGRTVFVVGYQPRASIPLEDYGDFKIGSRFTLEELDRMTDFGVIPPGTILQMPGGAPCVIRGDYNARQCIEVLQP